MDSHAGGNPLVHLLMGIQRGVAVAAVRVGEVRPATPVPCWIAHTHMQLPTPAWHSATRGLQSMLPWDLAPRATAVMPVMP